MICGPESELSQILFWLKLKKLSVPAVVVVVDVDQTAAAIYHQNIH